MTPNPMTPNPMTPNPPTPTSPTPTDRWQPTRAGLINVWRYWDETFEFHNGRLLLRGPNGSGKSLGLELLLPFLLDANAQPSRLTSAARSRGGLYDRMMAGVDTTTRAGFVWVEFRRGADVFTIGARVRASKSTRRAEATFFTTSLVVGDTLHLLDDVRAPLERKALIEAIGTTGRVSDRGHEHRSLVRETLYPDFTEDRYDALITALLALRKEKLSQGLDLDKMSEILSHALPPLEEHDLAAVAEGFERLDRRKDELAALDVELATVGRLATARRNYARVVTARTAGQVRQAESRRDTVTRRQRQAESELENITESAAETDRNITAAETKSVQIEAQIGAIQASDAYREGAALADLAADADRLARAAESERVRHDRAVDVAQRRRDEHDDAVAAHDRAIESEQQARNEVRTAANLAGADALGADAVRPIELDAWVTARRAVINDVRVQVDAHAESVAARDRASVRLADADGELESLRSNLDTADETLDHAVGDFTRSVRSWADQASAVGAARAVEAIDGAVDGGDAGPGEPLVLVSAVETAVARLERTVTAEQAVEARDIENRLGQLIAERDALDAEYRELEQTAVVLPESPSWRTDRTNDAGIALWAGVEVVAGCAPEHIDGIEAALRASGLLDAWIHADGSLELPDGVADLVLGWHHGSTPRTTRSLRELLEPAADPHNRVDPAVLDAVLRSITISDAVSTAPASAGSTPNQAVDSVVVATNGSFRLGAAVGQGEQRSAELIGTAARERRRRERLEELATQRRSVADHIAATQRLDDELTRRRHAVAAEFSVVPDGRAVTTAVQAVEVASARVADGQDRQARARAELNAAEDAVRSALRALTLSASQHALPTTHADLDHLDALLDRLSVSIDTWRSRTERAERARTNVERAERELAEARATVDEAASHLAASVQAAIAARAKVDALEATVGTRYESLMERLRSLDADRATASESLVSLRASQRDLATETGRLTSVVAHATTERDAAEVHRTETHHQLNDLIADGLVAEASLSIPTSHEGDAEQNVRGVLLLARTFAANLGDVDDTDENLARATARMQEALHNARAGLGGHVDLDDRLTRHGWWHLAASAGGVLRTVAELQAHLRDQLEVGRNELAEDEEALFERTLAGSIRQALAHRIRKANGLVDDINRQLGQVRTAAGDVGVRLRWAVDDEQPPAVRAARTLLLRDPDTLSSAERSDLHDFVRARVEQARVDLGENAPWHERLRETLDYRRWHRFGLQVAHRNWQGFKPATDRLLAGLSTGERSIALHLPMLASIVAHYSSDGNSASCPRLILLDELFAGVDEANRSQLFGTFTTWDLDAVFTSDHEWCTYQSLDGIAIHFLHPGGDDDPVTSTRFVWDGHQRVQTEPQLAAS